MDSATKAAEFMAYYLKNKSLKDDKDLEEYSRKFSEEYSRTWELVLVEDDD